jgi:hypothetical protein
MVDRGRVQDVNEAAARFAETLADSYRVVYGQATESAERQQQRAQEFSELVSSNLRQQSEAGRANAQQLSEEAARQQEAGQALARESVESYTQFLNDAFSRYRGAPSRPQRAPGRACAPSQRRPHDCWAPRPGRSAPPSRAPSGLRRRPYSP